jgi:hypothetical protein
MMSVGNVGHVNRRPSGRFKLLFITSLGGCKDYSYNIAKLPGFGHTFETPTAFARDRSVRYAALVAILSTPTPFSCRSDFSTADN